MAEIDSGHLIPYDNPMRSWCSVINIGRLITPVNISDIKRPAKHAIVGSMVLMCNIVNINIDPLIKVDTVAIRLESITNGDMAGDQSKTPTV